MAGGGREAGAWACRLAAPGPAVLRCLGPQVKAVLDDILEKIPETFNMAEIMAKAAEKTPYVVVAFQECERMNILTNEMRRSLKELNLGLKVAPPRTVPLPTRQARPHATSPPMTVTLPKSAAQAPRCADGSHQALRGQCHWPSQKPRSHATSPPLMVPLPTQAGRPDSHATSPPMTVAPPKPAAQAPCQPHSLMAHTRPPAPGCVLQGELTITTDMEDLSTALFYDTVPDTWVARAYPSMMGLAAWYADLLLRIRVSGIFRA